MGTQIKAFIALTAIAICLDAAAFQGHYTRYWGAKMSSAAHEVGSLHWTGFIR